MDGQLCIPAFAGSRQQAADGDIRSYWDGAAPPVWVEGDTARLGRWQLTADACDRLSQRLANAARELRSR